MGEMNRQTTFQRDNNVDEGRDHGLPLSNLSDLQLYVRKSVNNIMSSLSFSVIYWIRDNFPILCYLLLLSLEG